MKLGYCSDNSTFMYNMYTLFSWDQFIVLCSCITTMMQYYQHKTSQQILQHTLQQLRGAQHTDLKIFISNSVTPETKTVWFGLLLTSDKGREKGRDEKESFRIIRTSVWTTRWSLFLILWLLLFMEVCLHAWKLVICKQYTSPCSCPWSRTSTRKGWWWYSYFLSEQRYNLQFPVWQVDIHAPNLSIIDNWYLYLIPV